MLDVYNSLPFENADGGVWKQGWKIEYDPHEWNSHHKLKVFVVPHSHNDPGWLKTFDEYYEQSTKSILTNMLHQLSDNEDMTFIWAEISYFSKWYEQLASAQKSAVKRYVPRALVHYVQRSMASHFSVWWNAASWSLLPAAGSCLTRRIRIGWAFCSNWPKVKSGWKFISIRRRARHGPLIRLDRALWCRRFWKVPASKTCWYNERITK